MVPELMILWAAALGYSVYRLRRSWGEWVKASASAGKLPSAAGGTGKEG